MVFAPMGFIFAGAMAAEKFDEEEKEIKHFLKKLKSEKIAFFQKEAAGWKKDEDIVAEYDKLLAGKLPFTSMLKRPDPTFISNCENLQENDKGITIADFIDFLVQSRGRKEAIRIIKDNALFERTMKKRFSKICEFITSTNYRASPVGQGENCYSVEEDIFRNRKKLFLTYCPEQKSPRCQYAKFPAAAYWEIQCEFLFALNETRNEILKTALSKDMLVPTIITASGDAGYLTNYCRFLRTPSKNYKPNEEQINQTLKLAEKEAQKSEYKNLFIDECPAIKVKIKWDFSIKEVFDKVNTYECPLVKKALSNLAKTHE